MGRPAKHTPLLVYSAMTDSYYIATRYKPALDALDTKGRGHIIASRKYDVTDQMKAFIAEAVRQDREKRKHDQTS